MPTITVTGITHKQKKMSNKTRASLCLYVSRLYINLFTLLTQHITIIETEGERQGEIHRKIDRYTRTAEGVSIFTIGSTAHLTILPLLLLLLYAYLHWDLSNKENGYQKPVSLVLLLFFYILLSPLHWLLVGCWVSSHVLNNIIIENFRNILEERSSFSSPGGCVFVVFSSLQIQQKELPKDHMGDTLTYAMLEYILHNLVVLAKHCAPAFHLHLWDTCLGVCWAHTIMCGMNTTRWRQPSPLRSVGGTELDQGFTKRSFITL